MRKRSDLDPALGYPGGPCQVVQRIEQEVRDPKLRDQLVTEMESGDSLSNPEAAKVYDTEQERGAGFAQKLLFGPHSQYRMDLRGITVPQVRAALVSFTKLLNDWKSRRDPRYVRYTTDLAQGVEVNFTEPRMGLTIVFVAVGMGTVKLITTYWKGVHDERMPSRGCDPMSQRVASRYLHSTRTCAEAAVYGHR